MSGIHNNYDIHFAIDFKKAESIFLLLCIFYCFDSFVACCILRVSYLCLIFIDCCCIMHTVISRSFCLLHPLRIMFENSQQQFPYFFSYNFLDPRERQREREKSDASCSCKCCCCCCCYLLSCLVASSFPSSFLLCFVSGFVFFFFIFTPSCGALEALFHLSSELFFGRTQAALQFALHLKSRHSRL